MHQRRLQQVLLHSARAPRQMQMRAGVPTIGDNPDPCDCTYKLCGAGRYFWSGDEPCVSCDCRECSKGTFKPSNVTWGRRSQRVEIQLV
jgi:hypothetical protein